MTKFCNKCNIEKELNLFPKRKNSKDGFRNECNECYKEYKRVWSLKNYENNREFHRDKSKEWRKKNPDKVKYSNKSQRDKQDKEWKKEYMRNYRINNKEKIKLNRKKYLQNNPNMKKKFGQNRYKNITILQRIKLKMRNILSKSLKRNGYQKKSETQKIIGCSFQELKIHLEMKFEPWMSWENYGKFNGQYNHGWDIDHIIPLSSGSSSEEILKLNHFTNLQPLCSKVNRNEKRNIY